MTHCREKINKERINIEKEYKKINIKKLGKASSDGKFLKRFCRYKEK